MKQSKNGTDYIRFSLAVTRDRKNQLGEYETDFINCISYGAVAKLMHEYTIKGDKIGIDGRLATSTYEKDGKKVYTSEVVVEKLEFMTPKKNSVEIENEKIDKAISSVKMEDIEITDDILPF